MNPAADFFASLPQVERAADTLDRSVYRPAPDDWALVVTDVVDSTTAIARGEHKKVNFVAAMGIAALKNRCAPQPIPFLFGGDGVVVMVPPQQADAARHDLARVRGLAARDFGLRLRVALAPVGTLRRHGGDVRVGRYEPSPGNSFGVFDGGGVGLLEAALKGRGDAALAAAAAIPEALDDGEPTDMTGLSCRWDELRSRRGKMVTLIVQGAPDLKALHAAVMRLAEAGADARPARPDNLTVSWPPKGLMFEARAQRRGGSLAGAVLRVLLDSLVAKLVIARARPTGRFDPERYREEIAANTDFCRFDDTLCFVVDCPVPAVESIRGHVQRCAVDQRFRWGIDVADTALMTCIVTSALDSLHVHFVDGGGGGYTNAARHMKAGGDAAHGG